MASEPAGFSPRFRVDAAGSAVVSQAGAVVLVETVRRLGLDGALSTTLGRWREPQRLRLRLLSIAGRIALGARRVTLHLATHAPWTPLLIDAPKRLHTQPAVT